QDFVADPDAQPDRVTKAVAALGELLKKTRLELAPEQQEMIDGVATRLVTYREGIDRVSALIGHRARLLATLPPLRDQFETAVADVPDRAVARTLFRGQNQIASALLSHDPAGAEQSAQGMRSQTIDEPSLRAAVNAYADAIIAISRTESEIVDLDRQVL